MGFSDFMKDMFYSAQVSQGNKMKGFARKNKEKLENNPEAAAKVDQMIQMGKDAEEKRNQK